MPVRAARTTVQKNLFFSRSGSALEIFLDFAENSRFLCIRNEYNKKSAAYSLQGAEKRHNQ